VVLTFLLQPATAPSFVLTFTLDPMVVPKALELSPSNLLTTLVTLSNNSTAMTGKAALLRSVKTASLARDPDLVVVVSEELVEVLVEVSVLEAVDLVVGVDSVGDLEEVVVDLEAAMVEQLGLMEELVLFLLLPTPSLTMLRLVLREAKPSTFATFLGPQATRTWSSSSLLSERLSKPKSNTSQTADLEALVLFASTQPKMQRPLSKSSPVISMVVARLV